jgi:hypothetical protein
MMHKNISTRIIFESVETKRTKVIVFESLKGGGRGAEREGEEQRERERERERNG